MTGPMTGEALNAATVAFKKALIERALGAELSHHLGHAPGGAKPEAAANHRNGSTAKTVRTDDDPLRIEVPRDRAGSFKPVLIPKHERRFTGFDDKIGPCTRAACAMCEIQGFLLESYDPLHLLKYKLGKLNAAPPEWWQPRSEAHMDAARYPATDSTLEWANEIMALDQLLVEGLQLKPLRKMLEAKGKKPEANWAVESRAKLGQSSRPKVSH